MPSAEKIDFVKFKGWSREGKIKKSPTPVVHGPNEGGRWVGQGERPLGHVPVPELMRGWTSQKKKKIQHHTVPTWSPTVVLSRPNVA